MLAKWIVNREVVHIAWRSCIWVPAFQFTREMTIRGVVARAIAELRSALDDWEVAAWFARPNALLNGERPLELMGVHETAIIAAARVGRLVARG